MTKQEERREKTREFVQQVVNNQNFDATAGLDEIVGLSKEIRYDRIAANTEI